LYQNKYDLSGKRVILQSVEEKNDGRSIFSAKRYVIRNSLCITELQSDAQETGVYYGTLSMPDKEVRVRAEIQNPLRNKAKISFYNEEDEDYFDFLFDTEHQSLVTEEDESLDRRRAQEIYVLLDSEEYYFNIKIT
jgi:hypothetical protein